LCSFANLMVLEVESEVFTMPAAKCPWAMSQVVAADREANGARPSGE
jgi:hypothetical protein